MTTLKKVLKSTYKNAKTIVALRQEIEHPHPRTLDINSGTTLTLHRNAADPTVGGDRMPQETAIVAIGLATLPRTTEINTNYPIGVDDVRIHPANLASSTPTGTHRDRNYRATRHRL